ncbi:MAG: FtsQ-type POTRA domain-containing protein [Myxococcales bacterium]|nr:FtsQ-type POTRA domain-containing protein [Myxococcales bacterium]MCB9643205.1 FtsQ-type POTRA domain-containing protein [Myxococcales bacterium]
MKRSKPPFGLQRRNRRRVPTAVRVRIFARLFSRLVRFGRPLLAPLFLLFLAQQIHAYALRTSFFALREVKITQNQPLSKEKLLKIAGIQHGQNLLATDLRKAAKRLRDYPHIASARLRRDLPNRLVFDVTVYRPAAILQLNHPYFIDAVGRIFARVNDDPSARDLIRISGFDRKEIDHNPKAFRDLFRQTLALRDLYHQLRLTKQQPLREIQVDPVLGYILHAGDGRIYLGHDHFRQRLLRVRKIYKFFAQQGVRSLRYIYANQQQHPERVTVRLADAVPMAEKPPKPERGQQH